MKKVFQVLNHTTFVSIALLILRLVTGIAFILHGWGKIQSPFSWMQGSNIPGILQFLAALSEFGGGIALILGVLTPLASFGLACTMVVAVYFHAVLFGDPFVSKGGKSYELGMIYLVISILFMATGPGRYSIDRILFGARDKSN
jgi:putative oxidoreductase